MTMPDREKVIKECDAYKIKGEIGICAGRDCDMHENCPAYERYKQIKGEQP